MIVWNINVGSLAYLQQNNKNNNNKYKFYYELPNTCFNIVDFDNRFKLKVSNLGNCCL